MYSDDPMLGGRRGKPLLGAEEKKLFRSLAKILLNASYHHRGLGARMYAMIKRIMKTGAQKFLAG